MFYTFYIGKMIIQKKKGIQTDQIARGKKSKKLYRIELIMKLATYSIVIVELISIIKNISLLADSIRILGAFIGVVG